MDEWREWLVADYTGRLGEITVPALVIRGNEDRLVGPGAAVELARRIRGAEVSLVEGDGHCCPHTVPGATSAAVLDCMERHGL